MIDRYAMQVLVGFMVGIVLGLLWFALAAKFFFSWFPAIVSGYLGRQLMLRDGATVENVLEFEDSA